jgi:hypothetical protein
VISIQIETIDACWDESRDLLKINNDETGAIRGEEFAPNKDRYKQIEELGLLRLFTMRDAGKLVGYCVMFISHHMHYPTTLWAHQDVLFVVPEWRGFAAIRFIRTIDRALKESGVKYVIRQVTTKKNFSRTLVRMGYEELETSFMRGL